MKLPSVSLNQGALANFAESIRKEWIVANGLGGYASSTVLGINTRKYHGLLVAALHPPRDRRVLLSKLDEEVTVGNDTYPLGANEFQHGIFPQGHTFLREFSLSPFPRWDFSLPKAGVEKRFFVRREQNEAFVLYRILNDSDFDVRVRVFPLVNWRSFHSVTDRGKTRLELVQRQEDAGVTIAFGSPPSVLMLKATGGRYTAMGKWVEKVYYREEAARGESCVDDCYQSGFFEVEVKARKNENFAITAAAGESEDAAKKTMEEVPMTLYDVESVYEKETRNRENLLARFYEAHPVIPSEDYLKWIVLAADSFIVRGMNAARRSVIAGYPWFETWGRDTFVSLPGLMLVTGRFDEAREVLLTFREYCRHGLIPNFLPDRTEPTAYNSVDATLWYMNATLQYLKYTGDFRSVREQLWETLATVIESHVKGTDFEIHMDVDGLLSHGSQLTWMDAMVDGMSVTPRAGKAVEVQALWYNALRMMHLLGSRFGEKDEAERYLRLAEKAKKSFVEKFWNAERNCLYDVVSGNDRDGSLRPSQVIAVALDFAMLDSVRGEKVVDVVERELLTPYGLRTLSRSDPRYVGVYAGDRRSRDKAYHNGTVWTWLLGPLTTAFLRIKGYADFRREYAVKNFLEPLFTRQVNEAGLGTLSEIFDGEPPHAPKGCIAQAWSVAEPLRAYIEDSLQVRPKYESEVLQTLG
jgi:predicted glycogen debranching enzyme